MAALIILTLALFSIISVNAYVLRATSNNENQTIANTIACGQLSIVESILKVDFKVPASSITTPVFKSLQHPEFLFQISDLGFEDPDQLLRRVRVDVHWKEKEMVHKYALETSFYNY